LSIFLYKAKNEKGQIVSGSIEAKNEQAATQALWENKLKVLSVSPKPMLPEVPSLSIFNHVSVQEKAIFARQLSTMISAGIHLATALNICLAQTRNARLKKVITEVIKDVEAGYSFSAALAKHPDAFDRVFVSVVKAGEASGKLDMVLLSLADRIEKDASFRGKIKGGLIYPAFIFVVLIIIGALMMTTVIPKIKMILIESGGELPIATKMLIWCSDFLVKYWWAVLILIIALLLFMRSYIKTESGGKWWGSLMVYLPIFGSLNRYIILARFARTFGLLIKTGIPILDALYSVADVMDNEAYKKTLYRVAADVERGVSLSVPFSKDPLFPPIVTQMIGVGEQSGALDKILDRLGEFYENTVDERTKTISSLIEPIIIVILGLGVGVLVFAVLMPIYQIAQNIQ